MRKAPTRKLAAYFLLIQGMASLHAPVLTVSFQATSTNSTLTKVIVW